MSVTVHVATAVPIITLAQAVVAIGQRDPLLRSVVPSRMSKRALTELKRTAMTDRVMSDARLPCMRSGRANDHIPARVLPELPKTIYVYAVGLSAATGSVRWRFKSSGDVAQLIT